MNHLRERLVRCFGWVDRRVRNFQERFRSFQERLGEGSWRVIAAAILVVVLLPFAIPLLVKELNEPLFGDTAMMQYTAWAIRHGLKLYKDTARRTVRSSTSPRRSFKYFLVRATSH